MRLNKICTGAVCAAVMGGCILAPASASAQRRYYRYERHAHRQHMQNQWRDIAIGSGLLGALGLVNGDRTLFFAGTAGALYGAWRLNEDRRSDDRGARLRAEYFSRPYFYRDGARYDRHTIWRHGREYYRFERD